MPALQSLIELVTFNSKCLSDTLHLMPHTSAFVSLVPALVPLISHPFFVPMHRCLHQARLVHIPYQQRSLLAKESAISLPGTPA